MDDETLERLAREEILKEAKRGAARADVIGPQGWEKCPLPQTNKRFLRNTLFNAVGVNETKSGSKHKRKTSSKSEKKDEKKRKTKEDDKNECKKSKEKRK